MTATLSLSPLACRLIGLYQRYLSPRKGFRCAYGVLHGRDSCSRFASRAIEGHGLVGGARLTSRRFDKCRWASHVLDYERARDRRERRERPLWWMNGCNPGCGRADAASCVGDVALQGCCELPGACH